MLTIEHPIFKRGSVTSSNGFSHEYTDDELMLVCQNYSADSHKAPVQVGHVDSRSPAYGWIEKVRYDKPKEFYMQLFPILMKPLTLSKDNCISLSV
jgi:hypothetical protein